MDDPIEQRVELSIRMATQYLATQLTPHGWTDFETRGSGRATDWITGYVLAHLRDTWDAPTSRLLERMAITHGKLGFNEKVPADSDSSALGMLGLVNQGVTIPDSLKDSWVEFLREHICLSSQTGFSTYCSSSEILEYKRSAGENFKGWVQTPCPEITGIVALSSSRLGRLEDFADVISTWFDELASGEPICSYWWATNWYAIRVIAEACVSVSKKNESFARVANHIAHRLADEWQDGLQEREVSSFALANYLATGSALSEHLTQNQSTLQEILATSLNDLLIMQRKDGSWYSEHILRIPHPWDCSPWGAKYFSSTVNGTGGVLGDRGVFSTVTALHALVSVSSQWRASR